ncbi:MAG: hypothetical protein RLZZ127_1575, partial [Planctomycetota bacterium]
MSDLPRSVLSDAVAEACRDRRLVAAVFTTYTFDPAFFETEVLPVFMSRQFSADPAVRLAQLERRIADEDIQISVFYDPRGLQTGNPGAKLHIRRLTVRHGTGVFHPKTILALVEQPDPDQPTGRGQRSLLCMCLSANLTRSGWWENIEVAHIEEIPEGAKTSLRNELIIHVDDLARSQDPRAPLKEARERNPAITAIHAFLRGTEQRTQRSTQGLLHPAFHAGHTSFRTFLEESAGSLLRGMHMEILTPYFDHEDGTGPLEDLIQAFNPASVRISLPLDAQGQSTCPEHLHAWVKDQETMSWGRLPKDLHQIGTSDGARRRGLHAKVYRFFERRRGGKEILCIGSVNLTTPGCRPSGRVGNWESAILVE